jgi:protein-S-isoprenylcysteine O-methyltransferase Ste14
MSNADSPRQGMARLLILRVVMTLGLMIVPPFLAAGRWDWWPAWVLIAITLASSIISRVIMARRAPDLIMERARFATQEGAKSWDKKLVPLVAIVGPMVMWIVAGLDVRWGWSKGMWAGWLPIGVIVTIASVAFATWAMAENRFFSAVVRIQTDRGHTVCESGPYRWLRHPGYAGGILADLAIPLVLGSWWAFIPGVLTTLLIVYRTALEDRTLQQELPGYAAYAQRTRYRLWPGVW